MTLLCDLARAHYCNKGGKHFLAGSICHNYTEVYSSRLHKDRHDIHRVLEIGVNTGGSLRMWRDFFPNASIVGLDIDPKCQFYGDRISTHIADQSDPRRLVEVLGGGTFDVIIDDGSHVPEHQITTMNVLLPWGCLRRGGQYFVEDMTQPIWSHVPAGFKGVVHPCAPALVAPGEHSPYLDALLEIKHV